MIDWPKHFAMERQIRHLASKAGIPNPRARALASELASRRLPKLHRARLLAAYVIKRLGAK
jgi:hypothetical protein